MEVLCCVHITIILNFFSKKKYKSNSQPKRKNGLNQSTQKLKMFENENIVKP